MATLPTRTLRLMTIAPGHFHAALVQKQNLPGIHPRSFVYAPLDDDTFYHLARISTYNRRSQKPTTWEVDARLGSNFFERFLKEQPGNTVVLSGRNKPKIDWMLAAVRANLNVLADKPWIIDIDDYPKLVQVFREAEMRDVFVWDMMTERFEVTNILLRALVWSPEVFGDPVIGSIDEPAISLSAVHQLHKTTGGAVVRRPAWWFDSRTNGDGLVDVGTHLVDLALWVLFPNVPIQPATDVAVLDAGRWPVALGRAEFSRVSGLSDFPSFLKDRWLIDDHLHYFGNGTASFTIRGVHANMMTTWDYNPDPTLPDRLEVVARGTRSVIRIGCDPATGHLPQLYVEPLEPKDLPSVSAALARWCQGVAVEYSGLQVLVEGTRLRVVIPDQHRTGHEAHFGSVMQQFLHLFSYPRDIPIWERPNLLSKYYLTTKASQIARGKSENE